MSAPLKESFLLSTFRYIFFFLLSVTFPQGRDFHDSTFTFHIAALQFEITVLCPCTKISSFQSWFVEATILSIYSSLTESLMVFFFQILQGGWDYLTSNEKRELLRACCAKI